MRGEDLYQNNYKREIKIRVGRGDGREICCEIL